nr:hypothetical protein [uncultured Bacteroides sp.]
MPVDKFIDLETYYQDVSKEDDVLEYIWELAMTFFPATEDFSEHSQYGSLATSKFKRRYNDGLIDMPLTYETYKANNDIQKTIIGLGMDPDKFWYALLFIKDYTDGECAQEYKKESVPISELKKFIETISNYEIAECNPLIEEVLFSKEIELSILVNGKTEIAIKSPNAIKYIQSLCRNSLAQTNAMKEMDAMNAIPRSNSKVNTSYTSKVCIFANTFTHLFDLLSLNKGMRGDSEVSYSKLFLISRLIFLTRISPKEDFYVSKKYLKDFLRGKENKIATGAVNKIYG